MTVTTSTNKTQPLGNGVTTSFPYAFRIYSATDLVVTKTVIATGVDTAMVLNTDYTVTGAGSYNGGNVVCTVAPATGTRLTIRRVIALTQGTDLRNQGAYFAETHEDVFDRLMMIDQQQEETLSRSLTLPASLSGVSPEVPIPVANRGLKWNADGTALVNTDADPDAQAAIAAAQAAIATAAAASATASESATTAAAAAASLSADEAAASAATVAAAAVFLPEGTGAVATTWQAKARETKSFFDFMTADQVALVRAGTGYDVTKRNAMLVALTAAWDSALLNNHDLYAPAGLYQVGENNMPWRQLSFTELLDCGNITIYGDGPQTIFSTYSSGGADVFQLNGLKNFHVRNLKITATLTAILGSGSNGISITGGYDNISILDVWLENLPGIDQGGSIDGGKALTVQSEASTLAVGRLNARIFVKGCAQGFGFESNLVNMLTKTAAVDVDLVAEDCYVAFVFVAGTATSAIPAGTRSGVSVRGSAINCQRDVILNRAHGVDVDLNIVTTKGGERAANPLGVAWRATDSVIEAAAIYYAKNSRISLVGNKGACSYKAQIGGATAGSSGLGGTTQHCDIYLDIAGTASGANINDINSAGDTMSSCSLYVTSTTATTLPAAYYTQANANTLTIGPTIRMVSPTVSGPLNFHQGATGAVSTGTVSLFSGNITGLQGKGHSSGAAVAGLYDNAGTFRFGIINGNGVAIDALGTSGALGAYVGKHPWYNAAGALIGWMPLYG